MSRYRPTLTPDRRHWVILDLAMWGYCTLPDSTDSPDGHAPSQLPLEWPSRAGAEAWLNQCYRLWGRGTVPAPDNWRPFRKPEVPGSPFETR
jgi:hypothetical protein